MALPPSDRPPGAAKQAYHDDDGQFAQHDHSPVANGRTDLSTRPHEQENAAALAPQDRSRPSVEATNEGGSKDRSKSNGRRPSGQQRSCGKCQRHLTGQFVRALGDTYHLECFTCHDCGKIVASKFFPVPDQPPGQYPLCETDYFRRLDLLCFACGGALRGSYITALDRKYHIEHFTCSVCPTVFGAQDSYYEHEGSVYCHYHYSTKFAQKCNGCQTAILKQFVEIFRNGVNQHWHPECYMIHKYWNVRLHAPPPKGSEEEQALERLRIDRDTGEGDASENERQVVKNEEEAVEYKVHWIWHTLSTFEERSATCISDMLLHVSNGAYMDGVVAAKKFITHVDLLFGAADVLDHRLHVRPNRNADGVRTFEAIVHPGLSYSREAKLLCKKVVAFFQLLAENQDNGVRRLGVTQELLSLVTGLAHYLKLMIRICLSGALKLERETASAEGLESFLEDISKLEDRLQSESQRDSKADAELYVDKSADTCVVCGKAVEDKCFRRDNRVLHTQCVSCSKCGKDLSDDPGEARWSEQTQRVWCSIHAPSDSRAGGFVPITRLQQYVHLLRVAHARLLATLRTSGALPHTSDDPNLAGYDSREGHTPSNEGQPPLLRSNTRSRSYAGRSGAQKNQGDQSYEDTMGDVRRLRSTRMDKHLSNATKKARTSRIIDGPEGMRPGSADGGNGRRRTGTFQIVEDRDANGEALNHLAFGKNDAMTLDDIPRIVQAQQTREQRPNASRFARQPMIPHEPRPKLINGHTREWSGDGNERMETRPPGTKKYFSELTALEYFIVRHVAVLSMEPLLEGHFNQEELLELIESKRPTFWSKFGKAFQGKEKKEKRPKTAIFGIPLDQIIERDYEESTDGVGPGSLKIPSLVQECITAMRTMDMSVEGVFRKNGNIKRLNDVKEEIDNKGAVDVDLSKENPVQVAALLKKFLRELPDPLLTHKLHDLWITSQKIDDSDRRRRLLHLTCCLLPKSHRDTMEVLFTFLQWVSSFSHVDEESGSKMDIHNLATVITPNILHRGKDHVPVDDSFLAIEAVHSLIECNEAMCEVPEDLAMILNDSSLFSNSADITTKEILKRYGDRAKAPTVNSAQPTIAAVHNGATSPPSSAPVVTRVDTDPYQQSAWQNESSVRHVGGDPMTPPNLPYVNPSASTECHGSPNRGSVRSGIYDKQRAMGVA
ncbi:Rho-type GTPase-activating protein 1 [Fulvia fulva]|uniref:Rho-type GTPase-activating protein 1 n=1 Tax=Passalora fulva TaxID=5499 RepID=A0A9Q8L5F9_PASFU|nr:Rho-type GTPase-activating protein 1 [Fulvia fulva]KAK4635237.1 Rho-type GTPase-activating protein 1 [Fulvia fulva]KAK4636774.1 Rho-type GTPase-activating protein 1 [Fulvia fulva]UJO11164.1 Rho-type GTPase-activating protein 1 [Fulvia fulva]WPV09137.1 Rho-type GTPase-activating protein 1 [Fulvia fulva]WPV23403.1 Rho-type GTPase-activating protein 1 [Fulvia fulva]